MSFAADVITLFPELFPGPLGASVIGVAEPKMGGVHNSAMIPAANVSAEVLRCFIASKRRSSWTIGTNCRRRRQAIEGQSRLRLCTRSGLWRPTSIDTLPPSELPTRCARSIPSASMKRQTARANQAAS